MKGYFVVDKTGESVTEEPFATERKAYETKKVYEDNSFTGRPLRVVRADTLTSYGQCSSCGRQQIGRQHEPPCEEECPF